MTHSFPTRRSADLQKAHLFELMLRHYGDASALRGKTVALWGLAFKPNTDDMRAASSRRLLQQLWDAGAKVRAFDPEAMKETRRIFGERSDLRSEEHTTELQPLMRTSYAVLRLKKKI